MRALELMPIGLFFSEPVLLRTGDASRHPTPSPGGGVTFREPERAHEDFAPSR
jgi:hypothetical protein